MKAVDSNIVARYLTRDDPEQTAIAEHVPRDGAYVSLTVLLETAWLLRSRYRFARADGGAALKVRLKLPSVHVADDALVRWAIDRAVGGADIADVIHIVSARRHEAFVTFDEGLVRNAGPDAPVVVQRPA